MKDAVTRQVIKMTNGPIKKGSTHNFLNKTTIKKIIRRRGRKKFDPKKISPEQKKRIDDEIKRRGWK